jgi:hypothetical protein
MYEGRTRGKRMKYTYSDDEEDIYSDATTTRRSTRNTGTHTPAEPSGPTITQSGRQVKSRQGGAYGETILSETHASAVSASGFDGTSEEPETDGTSGRPRRAAAAAAATNVWGAKGGRHIEGYNNVDEMTSDDEGDASEQDYGDDEEEDDHVSLGSDVDDQDDLTDEDEEMDDASEKKLIVKLPVKTPTPERKTTIKLRLSPDKDSPKPNALFPATANTENATSASNSIASGANQTAVDAKENTTPTTSADTNLVNTPPKPMSVLPNSSSHQIQTAPLSPSLAFRGSPEKAPKFPPSIDVGSRGS